MAFDLAWNFRASSGGATDDTYAVPGLGQAYPHTYTAANGYSLNAGMTSAPHGQIDRVGTGDNRLKGINYRYHVGSPSTTLIFQADLGSGSAPGAGTYTIDLAAGDAGSANKQDFQVKDGGTVLIDGTNGGSGYSTATKHYIDATLADINMTGGGTWAGTPVSKTFSGTTVTLVLNVNLLTGGADSDTIAHFRLTLATVASRKSDFFPFFVPGLLSTPS